MSIEQKPQIFVGADGLLKFVYHDELAELLSLGRHSVIRASNVEPWQSTNYMVSPKAITTVWMADMSPSGGDLLGPFPRRQDAIKAEVEWLNSRMGNS